MKKSKSKNRCALCGVEMSPTRTKSICLKCEPGSNEIAMQARVGGSIGKSGNAAIIERTQMDYDGGQYGH